MRNIIIVPVKGNSKRFPGKNWKQIGGKTLFELALERAIKSELGMVVLATDSVKVVARAGCKVEGFDSVKVEVIPKELAEKRALDVCLWIIKEYQEKDEFFDNIIVTLPTSPLANKGHIKNAYEAYLDNNRETLISVTEMRGRPFLWSIKKVVSKDEGAYDRMKFCKSSLSVIYRDNGAVYIDKISLFLERKEWAGNEVYPYIMDEVSGVDIDTEWDYLIAKAFYKKIKKDRMI